jgi:protein-disulfide isomerase
MADLNPPVSDRDHVQGEPDARLTLVEYGDFQCPHCRIAHAVVKRLRNRLGADLRFVFRHFPLVDIHPMAEAAAEAAEYAASGGQFWAMYDAIFEHQNQLSPEMLVATLQRLSLDPEDGAEAIEEHRFADRIEEDMEGGENIGVHATPTFFINGKQYRGPWQLEDLLEALQSI